MNIPQNILDAVKEWLTPTFDSETQATIKEIITRSMVEYSAEEVANLIDSIKEVGF